MQTVDQLDVRCAEFSQPTPDVGTGFFHHLERRKLLFLTLCFLLAFAMRACQLDAAGLSEDETNKVFALRAYEQGDFTVNAEHPMVMKALCFASTRAAAWWNRAAGDRLRLGVAEETALRLPNAFFGALTVVPLLLLASALLGFEAGVLAALFWTFGVNAIWFNRIGKEDTLLIFFMLMGFYLYNRAKEYGDDDRRREKVFALAGAAFGLMLSSKYFPHLFGLNALFYVVVSYDSRNNRPLPGRIWAIYFAAMSLAFVVCNPAVFAPQTWRYLLAFVSEDLLTHHGYLMGETLYNNDMGDTPFGTPWYFYWLYLAIKVPLPVLFAFVVGVVEIFRHRGEAQVARGYLFLRFMLFFWLLPMTFIGSKFLRYTLSLMPLLYMTAAIGVLTMWRLGGRALAQWGWQQPLARRLLAAAAGAVFIVAPALSAWFWAMPHAGLYVNALAGDKIGYFFPHDEFYDLGARESIRYLAEHAPPNATIASDIPGVVQYYLERYGRVDIGSKILSEPGFDLQRVSPDYVLLQRGRVYFENRETFAYVQENFPVVQASRYRGAVATMVYQNNHYLLQGFGKVKDGEASENARTLFVW